MNLHRLIQEIKNHPDYPKAGMILCHNGVVRQTSRNGKTVSGMKITVDHEQLQKVIAEHKQRPGIVDIRVEIADDKILSVGDDVMFLVVAGDVRERVISTLNDTLNAIKTRVTKKTEYP